MKKFFLILTFYSLSSYALTANERQYRDQITSHINLLQNISNGNYLSASGFCSEEKNWLTTTKVESKCLDKYKKLYKKDVVDVRIAFGYLDAGNGKSYDRFFRAQFIENMVSPCKVPKFFACGFTRDRDDADIIYKMVEDVYGKSKKIKINITDASTSSDDEENLANKTEQKIKTKDAEENFFGGIENGADVVIYGGHSRDGGGPSFEPPRRFKDGHTDYPWYRKNTPGLNKMLASLAKAKDKPKIVSMLSCSSKKHFYNKLKKSTPETGFVLTNDLGYFTEIVPAMLGIIDSVAGLKCENSFNQAINLKRSKWDSRKYKDKIFEVHNFFEDRGDDKLVIKKSFVDEKKDQILNYYRTLFEE